MAEMTEKLEDWAREEQVSLWHDLDIAIRSAVNGRWSMHAASIARRIVEVARLVGPTPVSEMPWSLVIGGVYEAILKVGGVDPNLPDEDEFVHIEERMAIHVGTRATQQPEFAGTVAAIMQDREARFIRDGEE